MGRRINEMFTKIHKRYDLANRIYSAGLDALWRRDAARSAMLSKNSFSVLDIATGTAELAIEIARTSSAMGKRVSIVGLDVNSSMLKVGRRKVSLAGFRNIDFICGNAEAMPFTPNSFDVATSAFLLRNLDDSDKFCSELYRVIKRGGKFALLDMSVPEGTIDRVLYEIYFGVLMYPVSFFAGREAYKWLRHSLATFDKERFISVLKSKGFRNLRTRALSLGVGYVITGTK